MISITLIYFNFFFIVSISLFLMSLMFMVIDYMVIIELKLMSINSSSIMMVILLDWMSLLFMSFVLYISSMVIFYSKEYMAMDKSMSRFIMLVSMFVLSMMLLIISPNLISILLGWDGLGLVSYCLVIYYQNVKSYNAGMLTALSNRVGDVALLMGISWMLNYGSWNYIFYLELLKSDYSLQIVGWLVILAAMTKSAQIPFSSWLPAAMAAPTPVSSLVHSSTLVTAGIYLLIRFSYLFSVDMMLILMFIGLMTMFMAGLGANFEFDLKKIIALSTLSQLGLMLSILSMGDYKLSFFHLLSHALFKATLFMCAGYIIHMSLNCQDIRFMGNFIKMMPLVCCFFNISNLSLCGIPFTAGFYSKDLMLEIMSMSYLNSFSYIIFYLSTGLTVSYSFRLVYYSMIGNYNFFTLNSMSDYLSQMFQSMMGLIVLVIMGGSMLSWLMFSTPYFICLPFLMKIMVLMVVLLGIWLGVECSLFSLNYNLKFFMYEKSMMFYSLMWNMPILSTFGVNYYSLNMGKYLFLTLDMGWSEYLGSQNIFMTLKKMSMISQFMFMNKLKLFFLLMIFYTIILLIMML
uniref:NADH-ubiquinone oxidoreductase chain 5 n=1 Tax=Staphylinidae sp. BMNH 1274637 TaxID=1796580 RepID=A0A126TE74_9COLE|nr:NADH dehydrogenase subunit 5 [Staphylinidae sp. BMNH 1274637]